LRLSLKIAVRNDGDFVDVILLHYSFQNRRLLSGIKSAQRLCPCLVVEAECIQLLPEILVGNQLDAQFV
jgi:hypothetical protein